MWNAAFTSADDVQKRIDEYFRLCEGSRRELPLKSGDIKARYDMPCTVVGLANHLGVHRDTVYSYMAKEYTTKTLPREEYDKISDMLSHAVKRIEQWTLERAMIGDYDPKIAKLVLYGHGYRERDEDSPTVTVKIDSTGTADVDKWSK